MMKQLLAFLFLFTLAMGFTYQAQAELFNRGTDINGYRLIYDDDRNITWFDYTKSANTWQNQLDWASALTVTFGGTIFADWRLPSTVDGLGVLSYDGSTSYGYNVTNSEMGHLYYTELGNKAYYATDGSYPQPGWGLTNKGPFNNLLSNGYWSGTEYGANISLAWDFRTSDGGQDGSGKANHDYYAIAVRSGDVVVVPEPISSILFLTGGALLAGQRFIRRKV